MKVVEGKENNGCQASQPAYPGVRAPIGDSALCRVVHLPSFSSFRYNYTFETTSACGQPVHLAYEYAINGAGSMGRGSE